MKITDEYVPLLFDKEERRKYQALNTKLERFARNQLNRHWFRGSPGGITPSGDDYKDFVIRAYIQYFPNDGKFNFNREFENKLYQYIRREISRESRLKINLTVKNEAYYKERYSEEFNIFDSIPDAELSIRERLIEEKRSKAKEDVVREFCKYLKDEKYKMIIELFNTERISFERMLTKVTDFPIALINELINSHFIVDPSGLITEEFDRLDRPCKMKLNMPLKGNRGKSKLFGIMKMNGKPNKPQFNAYNLGMEEKQYYLKVRMIREQFIVFLHHWKAQGNNAKTLKELNLFQDI